MTTRAEHLAWCKLRALEYLDAGEPENAITSLMSDLGKHPETEELPHRLAKLAVETLLAGPEMARLFIEEVTA